MFHLPFTLTYRPTQYRVLSQQQGRQKREAALMCSFPFRTNQKALPFFEQPSMSTSAGEKVKVRLMAVGNAPIMKKNKFQIESSEEFHVVATFLRKQLRLSPTDPLFLYCNSSFAPSPDELLGNLHQCFQVNHELVVNYSVTNAWG